MIGPTLLLAVIFGFMLHVMHASDPPAQASGDDIVVVGHQWWWEVRYPKLGFVTANEVHIPGRQERCSSDSNPRTSFTISGCPELGRKIDMIPGRHAKIWLAADHPAPISALVQSSAAKNMHGCAFASSLTYLRRSLPGLPRRRSAAGPAADGERTDAGAGRRHLACLAPIVTQSQEPPRRAYRPESDASGKPRNPGRRPTHRTPRNNSQRWLHDPDEFKPGSHMPNLQPH